MNKLNFGIYDNLFLNNIFIMKIYKTGKKPIYRSKIRLKKLLSNGKSFIKIIMLKKIFITGGAGYVGSKLVPDLLALGYKVTVYDIMYFTDSFLPKDNNNLNIINGDIRDTQKLFASSKDHDIFIHLACISNDITFELDEGVSKSINYDCFEPMVLAAKKIKLNALSMPLLVQFTD